MRFLMRTLLRMIVVLLVAVGLYGLTVEYLDLPGGASQAIRALPAKFLAVAQDPANFKLPIGEQATKIAEPDTRSSLRKAIGCGPVDRKADEGPMREAWTWRDESGIANFADAPPGDRGAERKLVRAGWDNFFVSVSADEAVLPGRFEGELNAAAVQMYEQWRDWLGPEALRRSHIQLRFVGDKDAFMDDWGSPNSGDWKPLGFYRIRNNEAVVLYAADQRYTALATAFHEMSHLITAWHLGPSPPWLNEGIAEYFETMDLTRPRPRFWADGGHISVLRREGPVPLEQLMALSAREWRDGNAALHYASAWALVAFLFDSERGRTTLSGVVREAHAQRCEGRIDLRAALEQYPGGRDALEIALSRWIQGA